MANTRTLSAVSPTATSVSHRQRLRAVDARDEALVRLPGGVDVAGFLPPGATWVPAPPHTVPTLPGQPPMVGYLVLVPAEQGEAGPAAPEDEGPVTIDGTRRTARVDGRPLDLTYLEFELLAHLVAHPHRVHTRDQLVTTVWGYGHVGDGRTVDVHVARLRRKLGAEHRRTIQTVRRVGYKYAP
ncbi:winged helix family transcriptional regulator [Streptomyces sp. WAC05374]|uniref:winged helix-turn-helix domain-containing protein n=1 Tax=Streptomyces sp. WAC05374 TaxID=2487420 RepID=UPI000F88631A|nr:winged helix-turn-helix domain-containing protein [Streptomyces sp. WAC05374]RST10451.1 winged helix family transcriptional regulator [Streptomyces sp. WAC05374]TDF47625.1 winged helix family transcriptional regulator [Streptomyces sp. WAC05374]TDF48633.1 winged helix family transcriptional regulator [Streptomyces sp. WAC05374]TDF59117.1 winged helix family transcriptional regulator [Streptomyces sp. WAC05374]